MLVGGGVCDLIGALLLVGKLWFGERLESFWLDMGSFLWIAGFCELIGVSA